MLDALLRLFRRREPVVPPHDPYADWERIVGRAAEAWPVTLIERLTVAQAADALGGTAASWDALRAALRPGDQLWRFRSPEAAWRARCGRAGILLLRDGVAVHTMVTMLN
jgi:hypothetical protein